LAAMYFRARLRRPSRYALLTLFSTYVVLALPCMANALARHLEAATTDVAVSTAAHLRDDVPFETLIVFDGDNRKGRVRTAAAIYKRGAPHALWLLGDSQAGTLDDMVASGIPRERIEYDPDPANTRQQIERLRQILAGGGGSAG